MWEEYPFGKVDIFQKAQWGIKERKGQHKSNTRSKDINLLINRAK